VNLFPDEVYVFTPQGDVIALPHGATPVDFAFAVHTDIGHRCTAAKVDGKIVPLRHKLRNGNRVEVITSKKKTPSRDWLSFVKTSKARNRISNFINSQERENCLTLGKELLEKEILDYGMEPALLMKGKKMQEAMQASGYNSLDSMMIGIGFGKVSARHVVDKLAPKRVHHPRSRDYSSPYRLPERYRSRAGIGTHDSGGVE
jgi:GTP pyrophosphokinase